jgi:preprotein translocase subunit SecA
MWFFSFLFPDPSAKKLRHYTKELDIIKGVEGKIREEITTIEQVQAKTHEFQSRFAGLNTDDEEDRKKMKEILEEIKFEAFALHRRTCELIYGREFDLGGSRKMTWNMIPYDVQLIGGLALHEGNIAEMRTGEGKTLVATLPAYLNALTGSPVHIVTVNDYLARRDATEMGIIYTALGLTVWVITHGQSFEQKQTAYSSDIVYATNNELGFDYLRDNMATRADRQAMKKRWFAIVDEVDSILVDEARTPLIISAPDAEPTSKYPRFAALARSLEDGLHYKIDEKQKTATLTEEGIGKIEEFLGVDNIYVSQHYNDLHHVENALKAATVYRRDTEYLVRNDEILIVDEHTGRVLPGRRYSDGLHQAIEAKEWVTIQQESRTLASVTFQNYFRLYPKLAGMTGTAKTEEEEFYKIYHLEVIQIPTNKPIKRIDRGDLLFRTEKWKYAYLVKLIKELHEKWQPILVGTVSVAKSEYLSTLLEKEWVPHEVLNAKQDAREADIIANAWIYGAVTIATNMAGRGTDIKIDERVRTLTWVVKLEWAAWVQEYPLGGLFVIGTEKHETRRIDNQLRGRSGRQGDPGLSQFMLSPQDDIMRIFWGNRLFSILASFESHPESDPLIESKQLSRNITTIQKQVEWRNFDIRKHILEYDDVLNHHRLAIYSRRSKILSGADIHAEVLEMLKRETDRIVEMAQGEDTEFGSEVTTRVIEYINEFAENEVVRAPDLVQADDLEEVKNRVFSLLSGKIESLRNTGTEEEFSEFERRLTLAAIDELWMNHIDSMAHLREEVAFEWYAQKNPLIIYKERAYDKFIVLIDTIGVRVTKWLLTAKPKEGIEEVNLEESLIEKYAESAIEGFDQGMMTSASHMGHSEYVPEAQTPAEAGIRVMRADWGSGTSQSPQYAWVWRNDPCPCGSGKKYKHCHGK